MQDIYTAFEMDQDLQELRDATAAFLADQYDDGAYVATADDIADLERATAAFLADRADGEQFLLPASVAVDLVRAEPNRSESIIDLIDEHLYAQMAFEDTPYDSLVAAALMTIEVPQVVFTSFDDILGPNSLPETPQLPDGLDRLLDLCDDTDSDNDDDDESDAGTEVYDMVFDAPDALCPSQASYAASFFDTITEGLVPYASLDSLLQMKDRDEQPLWLYREEEDIVDFDEGGAWMHNDGDELLDRPTTRTVRQSALHIITHLPVILEEEELYSAVSDLSMDFADYQGVVAPLASRREDSLDDSFEQLTYLAMPAAAIETVNVMLVMTDDSSVSDLTAGSHGMTAFEAFDNMFADAIWDNEPDLELKFSGEILNDAEPWLCIY
ncbi:hypothetical protein C7974DRAFT_372975 [Boeremia exigua]|uniref:uncharacterized protein n=1 Tax=Boeremia exigua TaxID=749465 RepID=UPI001E8EE55A|nr:uncharacterized protein C7974DRAFT_372975 [Boeremia exigua]KAH6643158.1 hypothetical protein C7974DRAFT_372975 [Boeremia exigua]